MSDVGGRGVSAGGVARDHADILHRGGAEVDGGAGRVGRDFLERCEGGVVPADLDEELLLVVGVVGPGDRGDVAAHADELRSPARPGPERGVGRRRGELNARVCDWPTSLNARMRYP